MEFINITPINAIGKVGNTMEMALTHILLDNPFYREAIRHQYEAGIPVIVDNSYFELGYCLPPERMLKAVELIKADMKVTFVCPDGTRDGMDEFKKAGHKVMLIPKTVSQFQEFLMDKDVDLVGVSEEHFDRRHSVGARYNLFKKHMLMSAPKKIHMLGGTDTLWELALVSPFKSYIHSWDTSMPVWQGHLGYKIDKQMAKDPKSVNFEEQVDLENPIIKHNLDFVKRMVQLYE